MEDSPRENETYEEFQERVKRTAYVYNLSPQVTEPVLRAAFDQFFGVASIEFIPNFIAPDALSSAALVELKTEQAAQTLVTEVSKSLFMIGGMPRPVMARPAEEQMFEDRPRDPSRKITIQWLGKSHPDYEAAMKTKNVVRRHADEARFLLETNLEQEEKLAKRQEEHLKAIYTKYELIEGVLLDGSAKSLAKSYNMPKGAV